MNKLLKTLFAALMLIALTLLIAVPKAQAQPFPREGLTGEPYVPTTKFFTNALVGVGGLHITNGLTQITNGSTTITSAWVRLGGRGATLWLDLALTNALLTNIVTEWQFSRDGTNAAIDPVVTWRTPTVVHAVGRNPFATNLAQTFIGEMGFIRLRTVHLTNGVNTVGSVFATNNVGFALQRGS